MFQNLLKDLNVFFITSASDRNIVNVDDHSGNSLENLLHSLLEHGWGGSNSERELVVLLESLCVFTVTYFMVQGELAGMHARDLIRPPAKVVNRSSTLGTGYWSTCRM